MSKLREFTFFEIIGITVFSICFVVLLVSPLVFTGSSGASEVVVLDSVDTGVSQPSVSEVSSDVPECRTSYSAGVDGYQHPPIVSGVIVGAEQVNPKVYRGITFGIKDIDKQIQFLRDKTAGRVIAIRYRNLSSAKEDSCKFDLELYYMGKMVILNGKRDSLEALYSNMSVQKVVAGVVPSREVQMRACMDSILQTMDERFDERGTLEINRLIAREQYFSHKILMLDAEDKVEKLKRRGYNE